MSGLWASWLTSYDGDWQIAIVQGKRSEAKGCQASQPCSYFLIFDFYSAVGLVAG